MRRPVWSLAALPDHGDGRLEDQRLRRAAGARPAAHPGYARAQVEAGPSLLDDVARDPEAEAVLARQQAILNRPGLNLHLVIGEAALHQQAHHWRRPRALRRTP